MPLDVPSIVAFSALLMGCLGLLAVWLWRQDRSLVALALWGVAEILGAAGGGLVLARNVLPNWVTLQVAIAFLTLAGGVAWIGTRRFEQQPAPVKGALAGTVLWLIGCQIPWLYENLAFRVALVSAIIGAYELLCAFEFRRRRPVHLPSRAALAVLFTVNAAMQLLRAVIALTVAVHRVTFSLPSSPWFALSGLAGMVCLAGTTMLMIAVAKEEIEQRSTASLALARDTADRANLAKSRFLARMSHELRTPLNGVLGTAQMLIRDPALQGISRQRATMLEEAGKHLLAIINDVLDLASVEAGRFQLAPRSARLADIIQGSVNLVAETAAAGQVALHVDAAPDLPPFVVADPVRVRQILLNLLGNAIKFTPPGGTVTLRMSWHGQPGSLRLEVADTGRGVPSEIRPHLFRDFAQRPLDMAAAEGTGLGLAISASLARAMGGTLRYRPGPGEIGSVFIAELPLPVAAPVAEPDQAPVLPKGLRVLVVDDVASNRKLAEALLAQAGHTVWLAESGEAAIELLATGELPDVVLMDVFMPELDGLAATRRIRALGGAAGRVPIIALTADATPERLPVCRDAGMNGCVTKPFALDELLEAIAQAVRERCAAVARPVPVPVPVAGAAG